MRDERLFAVLSRREKDVVDLLLQGKSNKQIALSLGISERTVEFHLKNVYNKLQVASRVELIIRLGQASGSISADPVESTVDTQRANLDNGNQPARSRAARSLRNAVSLVTKEVAMAIQDFFEKLENYLRNHLMFFSLLVLLITSLLTRYVIFEIVLYYWVSYALLGLLLGFGSIRLGLAKQTTKFHLLVLIIFAVLCPLIAAGFDRWYFNTIVPYTGPVSISFAGITATAKRVILSPGYSYSSKNFSITSDILWHIAIAYMLVLFVFSRAVGKWSQNKMVKA